MPARFTVGEQGVPRQCGGNLRAVDLDAIQAMQQLFAPDTQVSGRLRGSVVAV